MPVDRLQMIVRNASMRLDVLLDLLLRFEDVLNIV